MTVRARLVLTIGAIAALLVLPAIYSVVRLDDVATIASAQRKEYGAAYLAVGNMQGQVSELESLLRTWVSVVTDEEVRNQIHAGLAKARTNAEDLRASGYAPQAAHAEAFLDTLRERTAEIEALLETGPGEAEPPLEIREVATSELNGRAIPVLGRLRTALSAMYADIDVDSSRDLEIASTVSGGAFTITLIALLICLTIAFALGAWTTRAITQPVMRLRSAMARVADGEFTVPDTLPYERRDEIGSVSRSFRSMTHRLADLDRLRAEFMSISTHELKTPINVISGYAELMEERVYGDLTDKQSEALRSIRDQAHVLSQLVNQLLDVSRLEAGGLRLHIQDVRVHDLIGRVARSFEGLAMKKHIAFEVDIADGTNEVVPGDADRIADQVLGNLLSNALKFTPEGGRIALRAWSSEEGMNVSVQDIGPGIPADQLPYIFDKFYQVGDQARSKGAGLGLAIANEVIVAHGGRITVESEPGLGTTFRITLPTVSGALIRPRPRIQEPVA